MREPPGTRRGSTALKPKRLVVNGIKLHARFSKLVFDALARLEKLEQLPPIPTGYVRFEASDQSQNDIPRQHLAAARRIDPGLILWKKDVAQFRRDEVELFRTLYFLMFAS
jgi:hypothetical protein